MPDPHAHAEDHDSTAPDAELAPHARAFFDYVRGRSDTVPPGQDERGMRAYRHLVWLGASQLVDAHHPELRAGLGDEGWRALIADFVRQSRWTSPFLGDVHEDFLDYLARQSVDAAEPVA